MSFKFPLADYNPEISYYGQPEGTLFQADENGNRTGQIGYSKTCWNYIVYISPSISQLNAVEVKTLKFSNMNFNVTPNINGEAYCGINKKLFTQAFQTLKRNPIKIQNDKTVIDFVLDSDNTRAKRENIELHTTITVVVVKTTPEELTAFVDALPDISSLVYSEHYTVVQSYNRLTGATPTRRKPGSLRKL